MKWVNIVIGVVMLIGGILIYPYYVTYFVAPMQAVIDSLVASGTLPALNLWEATFISALPLVLALLFVYIVVLRLIGRARGGDIGGDHAV